MAARPRKARRAAAKAATAEATAAASRPRFSTITANRKDIQILGGQGGGLRDFYHGVLTIPWWAFFLTLVGVYLGANVIFASLYLLDPGGVAGARPHSFTDSFFFSVETISTIGYGVMTPKSLYANVVMTAEAFSGLGLVAVATGLIFSRVSRPTARVIFTRYAVITPVDGIPTLMFRAANQRGNQILEAEATLNVFRQVITAEGLDIRTFRELKLIRARQPMFILTWLLMHRIDESSPIFGCTAESLQSEAAEMVVTLNGVDEVFGQRIYARHSYLPDEILFGRELVDVLTTDDDGRRVVNYYNFHEVKGGPDDPPH